MLNVLQRFDQSLFLLINHGLGREWLDPFFLELSALGGWTLGLVALACLWDKGSKALGRHTLALGLALLVLTPIHLTLKDAVNRPRPRKVFQEAIAGGQTTARFPDSDTPGHHGFPSGHSALAFFLMTYVALYRRDIRPWALGLAGAIALSRVYVGAHFPLDCLAGGGMGAAGGWLAWEIHKRFKRRREAAS